KTVTATFASTVADIIVDNPAATFTGSWSTGNSSTDRVGADYRFFSVVTGTATATATWTPTIVTAGSYDVYEAAPGSGAGGNRSTDARFTVNSDGTVHSATIDQQPTGGAYNLIASHVYFAAGSSGNVVLDNHGSDSSKLVIADAVKLVYSTTEQD